jgi:hypothetical protein
MQIAGRIYVRRKSGSKLYFYDIRSEVRVCFTQGNCALTGETNFLKGARLQVLAQAQEVAEGAAFRATKVGMSK